MIRWSFVLTLFFCFVHENLTAGSLPLPPGCDYNKECTVELPGSLCADGTTSYYTITARKDATKLLIYLSGGGACWSQKTCDKGYANPLTRVEPSNDWQTGSGIRDASDSANPFATEYTVVTVPYCTGDAYTGNKVTDYGSSGSPYVVRHHGYENVRLVINAVQKQFPSPEKVVLLGESAGGIGAYYHLRTLASAYPQTEKYVISDAGTPFKSDFFKKSAFDHIMQNWGARSTLPQQSSIGRPINDFGDLLEHNRATFPSIRFGFVSSYRDVVMTFFAYAIGAFSPFTTVKKTIIDVADNNLGDNAPNAKVFYLENSDHTHMGKNLSDVSSMDVNLSDWMKRMLADSKDWENIRPDKSHYVEAHVDSDPIPLSVDALWK